MSSKYKLCYVENSFAYFTTQPLRKQTGDDWNDIPYEHNAGPPYLWKYSKDNKRKKYDIQQVAWDGPFYRPGVNQINSIYSVDMINNGAVPWLSSHQWDTNSTIVIMAGISIKKFCKLIESGGGSVYFKYKKDQD